jgi:hypothetical protein
MPSPITIGDALFLVSENGIARCLDAKTGEEIWKTRIGGDHWASPLYAGGRLYFSSKQGEVTVLRALRKEPEIVARNKLNASFIASPAVAGEAIILRSTTHLYCLTRGFERSDEQLAADVYPGRKEPEWTALAAGEDIDWEEAYTQLLKNNSGVREKVESGGATKEQVIAWMKKQARSKGTRGGK